MKRYTGFHEEISPLNGEPILHWALSSGSSGAPKKFPITHSYRNQAVDIHLIGMASYFQRFPGFLNKPAFYLAASGPLGRSPAGIEISYISNYNYRHLPRAVRAFYGTPVEILKDEETMVQWRPLYALAQDSSAMVAVTPAVVVAMLMQIKSRARELYAYLSGKVPLPLGLPPLKISSMRLQQLEIAGLAEGRVDFSLLWPSLAFIACWTDSICRLQAMELRKILGPTIPVVETPFSATEAWVTVPLSSDKPGGPIHPGSVLVEFSPVGQADPAKLLKPWELKVGQDYELYVTNKMGLVRYRMFDILRCIGYFNEVAEISFVRKASQEISLGLLCMSETEFLQAVDSVRELEGRSLFFSPSANGRGLTLYVASEAPISAELARRVDDKLCALNPLYFEELQPGGSMDRLEIRSVPPDHKVWQLKHSQAKSYLIRHSPPSEQDLLAVRNK